MRHTSSHDQPWTASQLIKDRYGNGKLSRCLCFGKGEVDFSWGDPNEHHRLRCTAFISLLHTLHKCASYFTKASNKADTTTGC